MWFYYGYFYKVVCSIEYFKRFGRDALVLEPDTLKERRGKMSEMCTFEH